MLTLSFSPTRCHMRQSALQRDERQLQKRFDHHNEVCRRGLCALRVLEDVLVRELYLAVRETSDDDGTR
jgi:hypothetical protein